MDFFEAQARAHRRTKRLVVLFALAVIGTIAAGYLAANALASAMQPRNPGEPLQLQFTWDPALLAEVVFGTFLVVGLASGFKWLTLRQGGAAVAEMVGARKVDPRTTDLHERRLLNVVEEMAIAAGIPMPAVYILDQEPGINAFAAGHTASDAVVTVTRGTLEKLSRDELQGVVGHEFSHILNGDMRLNLRLAALIFGILVIGLLGRGVLNGMAFGNVRASRDNGKGGGGVALILAAGLALMLVGYIGYFFGRLIQAAVSRQREFLADASSVQFTRNPAGITGALKKIGGYALGSDITTHQAAQIGHFFFAQGFRSNFGGLWATHPPLGARIRAVDGQWDGKFIDPPQVVDVARESFRDLGLARQSTGVARGGLPGLPLPAVLPLAAAALVASAGTLTPAHVAHAQNLLASLPPRLRDAARDSHAAPVLLYGLLIQDEPAVHAKQLAVIATQAGADTLRALNEFLPALGQVAANARLPLAGLLLPALRGLPPADVTRLSQIAGALIDADGQLSYFEFAVQKVVFGHLANTRQPVTAGRQIFSFDAVAGEIALVLSACAHAAGDDAATVAAAFAAAAAQLKILEGKLALLPPAQCGFAALDSALDRLATASLPIKQRLLTAAAHAVTQDGRIRIEEAELLRAVADTLGCPLPPLLEAA